MKERGEEASSDIGPLKRPPFTYKILKIKLVKVLVLIISISKNLTTTKIGGCPVQGKWPYQLKNAVRRPCPFQPRRRPTGTGEDESTGNVVVHVLK